MATEFVIDGDEGYDPDRMPPVPIRIDGTRYTAHCPKDSVGLLFAELEEKAQDPQQQKEIVLNLLRAFLDDDDAAEVMGKVLDIGNRMIGISYITNLLERVAEYYRTQAEQQQRDEEMGIPPAANREERRAAKKTPAKKTAAKTTARTPAKR